MNIRKRKCYLQADLTNVGQYTGLEENEESQLKK